MSELAPSPVYLFCFARSPLTFSEHDWGLEEDQPLQSWSVADVTAVGCPTDPNAFRGPGSESRLRDVAWVGPRALRHQQVVERVLRDSPVLPCRFGTLFSSPAAILDLLRKLRPAIASFLDYIVDKEEWAAKAYLDVARAEAWLERDDPALAERRAQLAEAPGRRYFQEKQLRADVRKQTRQSARELSQRLQRTLAAWALAVQPLRLSAANGAGRELLFSSSLLVCRGRAAELGPAAARLNAQHAERGVTVELSGPWPPYSFSPALAPDSEAVDEVSRLLHTS